MVKASIKTGSNFLVVNKNQHGYSSEEDNTEGPYVDYDFTATKRQMRNMKKMALRQKKAVLKTWMMDYAMTHMLKMMMMKNTKAFHSYIMTWYVIHKTRQVSQRTGSYWTANPL